MQKELIMPFSKAKLAELKAGDTVLITGKIYTARDAAHKRILEGLQRDGSMPFEIRDAIIYYVGPTPSKPGYASGSAGPTTSYRMDAYAPTLLDIGQAAMIGKGQRSEEVYEAIVRNGAVYFAAIGGAGALIAKSITTSKIIAYDDLGAEAVRELEVNRMPVTVIIDAKGNDLYKQGPEAYLATIR